MYYSCIKIGLVWAWLTCGSIYGTQQFTFGSMSRHSCISTWVHWCLLFKNAWDSNIYHMYLLVKHGRYVTQYCTQLAASTLRWNWGWWLECCSCRCSVCLGLSPKASGGGDPYETLDQRQSITPTTRLPREYQYQVMQPKAILVASLTMGEKVATEEPNDQDKFQNQILDHQ